MTWLWGCLIIFFKGCIGSILFILGSALIAILFSGIIYAIAWMINHRPYKTTPKEPQTWQEWAQKQDGELKSLLSEIDKDLK